jgi:hypothetical protein
LGRSKWRPASDRFDTSTGRIALYQRLNEKFGTNIDFSFVAGNEGGQRLKAYVPPVDRSGVTVATGFDIGAHTSAEISALGLSSELEKKLLPYAAKGPGLPLSRADADEALAKQPLILTRKEAMELDFSVKADTVTKMLRYWAGNDPSAAFTALTPSQQTVLTDRSFQFGVHLDRTAATDFYADALAGNWKAASQALKNMNNYQTYQSRIDQNIKLLNGGR